MLEIIFVRHGETDWNVGQRIMGDKPVPLNEAGRQQVGRLSDYLRGIHFDVIYTSPIVRTRESAEILQQGRQIPVVEADELTEINYGPWVGQTFDEVQRQPEFYNYHHAPSKAQVPGGESMHDVLGRVTRFVEGLRQQGKKQRVLAVSHADVIKLALVKCLALPLDEMHRLRIDNGSCSVVYFNGKLVRVLVVNSLPHLDGFFDKMSLFTNASTKKTR